MTLIAITSTSTWRMMPLLDALIPSHLQADQPVSILVSPLSIWSLPFDVYPHSYVQHLQWQLLKVKRISSYGLLVRLMDLRWGMTGTHFDLRNHPSRALCSLWLIGVIFENRLVSCWKNWKMFMEPSMISMDCSSAGANKRKNGFWKSVSVERSTSWYRWCDTSNNWLLAFTIIRPQRSNPSSYRLLLRPSSSRLRIRFHPTLASRKLRQRFQILVHRSSRTQWSFILVYV